MWYKRLKVTTAAETATRAIATTRRTVATRMATPSFTLGTRSVAHAFIVTVPHPALPATASEPTKAPVDGEQHIAMNGIVARVGARRSRHITTDIVALAQDIVVTDA